MKSDILGYLLDGKIRLRPLQYYRRLEEETNDRWIGDRNEGIASNYIDHIDMSTVENKDEIRDRLEQMGISISPDSEGGKISRGLFETYVDCFVFCVSRGTIKRLSQAMCSAELSDPYDSCVRIMELESMARAIWESGRLAEGGARIPEVFQTYRVGLVQYKRNYASIDVSPPVRASPFVKDPIYSSQSEARIVLYPKQMIDKDFIDLNVDFPSGLLREEFRNTVFTPPQVGDPGMMIIRDWPGPYCAI